MHACVLQDIDTAAAELAASAPNMKALEQYEAIREKEKQQVGHKMRAHFLAGVIKLNASHEGPGS